MEQKTDYRKKSAVSKKVISSVSVENASKSGEKIQTQSGLKFAEYQS